MTKAAIKKRVEKYFKEWKEILGVSDWDIKLLWDEEEHLGTAEAMPEYLSAKIHLNLTRAAIQFTSWEEVEDLIVHELCHLLLWSLARGRERWTPEPLVLYLEEQATQSVTNALLRARKSRV